MGKKKALVEVYNYYAKSSGEELMETLEIEDTRENRDQLIDIYFWDRSDLFQNEIDDFLDMKTDYLSGDLEGGDWDEPTGRRISMFDKEKVEFIEKFNAEKEIELQKLLKEKFG